MRITIATTPDTWATTFHAWTGSINRVDRGYFVFGMSECRYSFQLAVPIDWTHLGFLQAIRFHNVLGSPDNAMVPAQGMEPEQDNGYLITRVVHRAISMPAIGSMDLERDEE